MYEFIWEIVRKTRGLRSVVDLESFFHSNKLKKKSKKETEESRQDLFLRPRRKKEKEEGIPSCIGIRQFKGKAEKSLDVRLINV